MGFGVGLEWVTEYWGRLFWWKRKFLEGEVFDANNTLSYESKHIQMSYYVRLKDGQGLL